jgi:hypothetical protein
MHPDLSWVTLSEQTRRTSSSRRAVALRALLAYVVGAIQIESPGPLAGPGTRAIAGLPPDEFPNMAQTARDARTVDRDQEFRGGLAILLRGMT